MSRVDTVHISTNLATFSSICCHGLVEGAIVLVIALSNALISELIVATILPSFEAKLGWLLRT